MPDVNTSLPGVFGEYEDSGIIFARSENKAVGIVAVTSKGDTSRTYEIKKGIEAKTIFGTDGHMEKLCDIALKNGAHKVIAVSAGRADAADYESAFELLKDVSGVAAVICDSENVNTCLLLKNSVESSCESGLFRVGIISGADANDKAQFASEFNSERIMVVGQHYENNEGQSETGFTLAASLAGLIANAGKYDFSFKNVKLKGISGVFEELSRSEINTYIESGITPFEYELNDVKTIRLVTSKTTTSGVADETYRDISTTLIIDKVTDEVKAFLDSKFIGEKNNVLTRESIKTQVKIKLKELACANIIKSYTVSQVSQDAVDATKCNVQIGFTPADCINRLHVTANIRL